MPATTERHEFQAEVKQLLDLLINSLYSNKDIFLRELTSNASDALDKLRFAALTDSDLTPPEEFHIRIDCDKAARTLSLSDNGIGMTHDELVQNIGTIAHSGTTEFIKSLQQNPEQESSLELIGQFGVGFYSSFIVADRVTVLTRRAGAEEAFKWESSGDGEFTIEPGERDGNGTTVTLHLRAVEEEDGLHDYTDALVLREIIKRHSDFVAYPIKMKVEQTDKGEEGEDAKTEVIDETINSMKAIWTRPADEVSEEEHKEFYSHIARDWTEPLTHLAVQMEGKIEARALLYIPSQAPFDLYHREMSYRGLQLYIKRVFIMDECKDLMPTHLRFIKGVVDSDDLTLNVSREILQQDRKIAVIKRFLVKKIMGELQRIQRADSESYHKFWMQFGPVMKEGLLSWEADKDPLLNLLMCHSSRDDTNLTTLNEYVDRMPEHQKNIYFMTGPSLTSVRQSPHLEVFVDKGYEVLLFTDNVDEVWLASAPEFKGKPWKSVGRGDVELESQDEKTQGELDGHIEQFKKLTDLFQELLVEDVKEVRITSRLTSSPACLVSEQHDMSPQIIEVLRQAGQEVPKVKRILEVNPKHSILQKLQARFDKDRRDPVIREYAELIYGQALLAEGGQPADPAGYSKKLADALDRGL